MMMIVIIILLKIGQMNFNINFFQVLIFINNLYRLDENAILNLFLYKFSPFNSLLLCYVIIVELSIR